MKQILVALVVLVIAGAPALAVGPNAGGTLVVHDTGLTFSSVADLPAPPPTTPPVSCDAVDAEAPLGSPELQTVWKVYAAFPAGSSPRLKALVWGIVGAGAVYVTTAGLPDPPHCFQIVDGSWPSPPGSIGQSFVYTQTAQFVECYWFGGYSYGGEFSTAPHPTQPSQFLDDAVPGNIDDIAGFSSIGFGFNGWVACQPPPVGACCFPDGTCMMISQDACVGGGVWYGGDCYPALCTPCCDGACCLGSADCEILPPATCEVLGGVYQGDDVLCTPTLCLPNPVEQRSWGRVKAAFR